MPQKPDVPQFRSDMSPMQRIMTPERKPDINLPDESAGKPVGMLHSVYADSKDKNKAFYMKYVREHSHVPPTKDDEIRESSARQIFGGDADDPRWDEHRKRLAMVQQMKDK